MIIFFYESKFKNIIKRYEMNYKNILYKIINLEKKKNYNINLIYINEKYMIKLKYIFLKNKKSTDVLSFNNVYNNITYVDIFINIDDVLNNCIIFNQLLFNELKRVIIHGILHVIGYNDNSIKEKKKMKLKEDFYLFSI